MKIWIFKMNQKKLRIHKTFVNNMKNNKNTDENRFVKWRWKEIFELVSELISTH